MDYYERTILKQPNYWKLWSCDCYGFYGIMNMRTRNVIMTECSCYDDGIMDMRTRNVIMTECNCYYVHWFMDMRTRNVLWLSVNVVMFLSNNILLKKSFWNKLFDLREKKFKNVTNIFSVQEILCEFAAVFYGAWERRWWPALCSSSS